MEELGFLLMMVCFLNDDGKQDCDMNLVDQYISMEHCLDVKSVLENELGRYFLPGVAVEYICDK